MKKPSAKDVQYFIDHACDVIRAAGVPVNAGAEKTIAGIVGAALWKAYSEVTNWK